MSGLVLDAGWAAGVVLAMTRVAGFAAVSPLLPKILPMPARLAFSLAIGLFLADPVEAPLTVGFLVGAAAVNATIGAALGYLTGLVFEIFPIAGGLLDITSGLSIGAVFDPAQGDKAAVYSRLFTLTALTAFHAGGGLALIVSGLAWSRELVPLHGIGMPDGRLAELAVQAVSKVMIASLELALPVVGLLFVTELVLGVASRFAPQANVFLIGLPAKILVSMLVVSLSVLLFPEALDGIMRTVEDGFLDAVRGLR